MSSLPVRIVILVFAIALLGIGGLAICKSRYPGLPGVSAGWKAFASAAKTIADAEPRALEKRLANPVAGFGAAGLGLLFLVYAARAGRTKKVVDERPAMRGDEFREPVDKREQKKTKKEAKALARKGELQEAAELCFHADLMDLAADYFQQAEDFVRAAEIRHDQNRFEECAQLYLEAGQHESAGSVFASQELWGPAAEAYLKAGRLSVAAEMFEKAGDDRRAGDCYSETGFQRHAAQAYVRAQAWGPAARALEETIQEETTRGGGIEPDKLQEFKTLVLQAGKLYEQASDLEHAQAVLERGECWQAAAEMALRRGLHEEAADLFRRAANPERAADALREAGQEEAAARLLAEYHRDQNQYVEAAEFFEQAEEWVQAADLLRQLEEYPRAGEAYVKAGEHHQAAEMFRMVDDVARAGECYVAGGLHAEAGECFEECGDARRAADAFSASGQGVRAGQIYQTLELEDEAIKALQQVPADDAQFQTASALLGDLFRAKGEFSVAITKLEQAVGEAEIDRENVTTFYTLAGLYEAQEDWIKSSELYERILAFDYHYEDVEDRLSETREKAKTQSQPDMVHTQAETLSTGGRPGRYQILGELGRGGMGIVYKAKDTVLDRVVALKTLPDALKENPQALKNFLREAKSAAQLNHPGIVTVYDAGEQEGCYYIAMEYVDGTTLKEVLRRRKVIPPKGVLHVLVQLCEALAYAHEKKIVHRDVKTANTMWTRDRKAKIMDFGLAKVVEEVRNHTTLISGTPYYMSPEQTLGSNVDHRTDIYSLGVTLFELATGTLPFRDGNVPYHHVHTAPPDPVTVNPELPPVLGRMVLRCLEKDPDARYQSTLEILDEIRTLRSRAAS